jgi:4-hydroxythreonine-4-phosphate dehydrogenase
MTTKPLVCITTGEPAGIGPEICLDLVNSPYHGAHNLLLIGDPDLLAARAQLLSLQIELIEITDPNDFPNLASNQLAVLPLKCPQIECIGKPVAINSPYVIETLDSAISLCQNGNSKIIVTAPVNKDILNYDGLFFNGHTEYFAEKFAIEKVVMMLSNPQLNVALLTTHLPLKDVAAQVTASNLNQTLQIIHDSFRINFGVSNPKIAVCGLNPHAGENGYLGREEIEIIDPGIKEWQQRGFAVYGSFPADTVFNQAAKFDVILAMYHDQGLPVVKYSDFEQGVNVTLGLPIIRTSVDHGTALDLAGTGRASPTSLHAALAYAIKHTLADK